MNLIYILIIILIVLETIALGYTLTNLYLFIKKFVKNKYNKVLEKSAENIVYKTKILDWIDFIGNIGVNVASVTIIALVVISEETAFTLTAAFIFGILIKYLSIEIKAVFTVLINNKADD
jgi:hypothetical protein